MTPPAGLRNEYNPDKKLPGKKLKINRISIYQKNLPLEKPYRLSGGRLRFENLDSTFVRLDTDAGISGWGEGCPWGSAYLPAHGAGIRAAATLLAPALLGMDPRRLEHINRRMDITLPGHLYAKSPFDIACWDVFGQAANLPIADLLGGCYAEATPIISSISTAAPAQVLDNIRQYRACGYHLHSVKIGAGVAADIEQIRYLEANRGAGEAFYYDVNRAWLPADAIRVMNAVRDQSVVFEQPCETLEQCATVRARTLQPISIDERLETPADMRHIITARIGEIVNLKINRCGGLTKSRQIRDLALSAGIRMLVMETGGSVIADTAAQHFAQSVPAESRVGTWLCQEMLTVDTAPGRGSRNVDGHSRIPPNSPGLGVAPQEEILGAPLAVYE